MKLNLLISYAWFTQKIADGMKFLDHADYRLMIDSGAFTAWNLGKKIELDKYCAFLDSIDWLRPFHAIQLDVIGNPDKTYKNYLTMKERGHDVIPVFTRGSSLDLLEEYYKHTDYVMLGGVAFGEKNSNYVKWFSEKNKGRKAHWLGFTKIDLVKKYKPTSIDSSSWQGCERFGNLSLYDKFGKFKTFKKKEFKNLNPAAKSLMLRLGFSAHDFYLLQNSICWRNHNSGKKGSDDYPVKEPRGRFSFFVSTVSYLKQMMDLEKNLGTKSYVVCSEYRQLRIIYNCYNFIKTGEATWEY